MYYIPTPQSKAGLDTFKAHFLFPTVIATVENPNIPYDDHATILKQEYVVNPKHGPFRVSKEPNILKHVPTLYGWIQSQIDRYARDVMSADALKITQSWAIIHQNETQAIYEHTHSNSILSGSYYVDAPEGTEGLTFSKTHSYTKPFIDFERQDDSDKQWLWDKVTYKAFTGRLNSIT